MIYHVSYCAENMAVSGRKCCDSFEQFNEGISLLYHPGNLDYEFVSNNKSVINLEKGAGLYIWKPYIINRLMRGFNDGDILIYSDAGVEFINNVNHIIDRMDQDIWLFGNMFDHEHWCKEECLSMMNIYKGSFEANSLGYGLPLGKQVQASVIFIRVSPFSRKFIKEWLLWCQMPGCIETEFDPAIQHPQFKEHRWDQAILTNLAIKHDIKLHYWPASYNNGAFTYDPVGYDLSVDNYPILFNHHRKRNNEW